MFPTSPRSHALLFAAGAAMALFLLLCPANAAAQQPDLPDPALDQAAYREAVEAWRAKGDEDYRTEGHSPFKTKKARKRFMGRAWFPVDPQARVTARIQRFWVPDTVPFPTSAGTVKQYIRWAELVFTYKGHTDTLVAYRSVQNLEHPEYGRLLFVPFTDQTSGESTYGGGRYLDPPMPPENDASWDLSDSDADDTSWDDAIDDDASWENDTLILDFNTAYNPYCAVADGWFCPIPPAENFLNVALEAGEQMTKTKH